MFPSLISLRRLSSACLLSQPISLSSLFFQLVYTLMPLIEFQTKDQLDQLTLFCIRRGEGMGGGGGGSNTGSLPALLKAERGFKNVFSHFDALQRHDSHFAHRTR